MSQKQQAETHVRARVVVGNGWGRGGAIQDQDGHPLSALALITHVQPTRGKQASPHSSTAAGTDPCWWRSPSRGSMNSVRLENIKILFYLKPELSHHSPPPQLLSPDNPYSILVTPDLLEGCPRSRLQTELRSLGP